MIRTILTLSLFIFFVSSWAQQNRASVNVSIWDPLATLSLSHHKTSWLSLGIPESKTRSIQGFSCNLFNGIDYGKMNGVQVAGIYSRVDSTAKGFSYAGLYNIQRGMFTGLSASGLMNINKGNLYGVQTSAIQNIEITDLKGIQIGGFMNIIGGTLKGMQITAGFNVANSAHPSAQLAGLINFGLHDIQGVQVAGIANYAYSLSGVQIGLLNFTKHLQGVQIGIINYSADTNAVKIGLVSVSPHTQIRPVFYWSNVSTYNVGIRFMNHLTYSIIGFGTPYDPIHYASSGLIFYRIGIYHHIKRVTLSSDLGISYLLFFTFSHGDCGLSREARINAEYAFTKGISAFASGGYTARTYFFGDRATHWKPIAEIGIILPNILQTR
jgi:hypothetical protein